tara:strand:- start:12613 stop:13428 length:816 start_codon:yes stop_codon:yes gene_type:complete
MAAPNSKATFKEYIKRALGHPVVEINIDDDQLDDRVDEALQYFREFHYDGSIKCYLKHKITQTEIDSFKTNETHSAATTGTQAIANQTYEEGKNYITLPEHVLSVINIFPFHSGTQSNMFDIQYQLRLNDLWDLTSTSVLYYHQVQSHLALLNQMLVGQVPIRYNMHANRLYIDYNAEKLSANEYIIIECYRKIDPNDMTDVYNDMWLKKYATAKVKYQWGENLSKFQGIALPGGVTLDSERMKTEAQEEITKLEEESRLNYEMPVMDMMG